MLTAAGIDADRLLLGLMLLLCGTVPAVLALVREKRAPSRALRARRTFPPRGRRQPRSGALP
jgi:hypothetical protein